MFKYIKKLKCWLDYHKWRLSDKEIDWSNDEFVEFECVNCPEVRKVRFYTATRFPHLPDGSFDMKKIARFFRKRG